MYDYDTEIDGIVVTAPFCHVHHLNIVWLDHFQTRHPHFSDSTPKAPNIKANFGPSPRAKYNLSVSLAISSVLFFRNTFFWTYAEPTFAMLRHYSGFQLEAN